MTFVDQDFTQNQVSDFVSYDPTATSITCLVQEPYYLLPSEVKIQVDVRATLSDGETIALSKFEVVFQDPTDLCKSALFVISNSVFKNLPEMTLI